MRNNLRITLISAGCGLILLCVASGFAQIKVGGYKNVPTDDETVIDAAEFAANAQSDRVSRKIDIETIAKAERQTVAGANYRICMEVAVGEENEEPSAQFVRAIIFYSLKKEFTLKSWVKVKSCV